MRAIGYQTSLPSADPASLTDIDLPRPEPSGHDLLVRVEAVSMNPVDTKVRMRAQPEPKQWKVLGWDAAGSVEAVGPAHRARRGALDFCRDESCISPRGRPERNLKWRGGPGDRQVSRPVCYKAQRGRRIPCGFYR